MDKAKRGFARLDPERRRAVASMGGKSVPAEKRAFAKDPLLASRAGRRSRLPRAGEEGSQAPRSDAPAKPFAGWLRRRAT